MSTLQTVLDDLVASGEGLAEVTIGGLALVGIAVAGHAAIALYRAVQEGQPALGHILGIIIGSTMTIVAIIAGWVSLQIVS
jgi:hypothetical protein